MLRRYDTGDPDEYLAICDECDGEGSRYVTFNPDEPPEWVTCPDCGGYGHITADASDFWWL